MSWGLRGVIKNKTKSTFWLRSGIQERDLNFKRNWSTKHASTLTTFQGPKMQK